MSDDSVQVTRWPHGPAPTEAAIQERFHAEGLSPYRWSNGAGEVYAAHSHPYHKVIYVIRDSITCQLPLSEQRLVLAAGDRLDLPPDTAHDAVVGPEGVVCLEAHRD